MEGAEGSGTTGVEATSPLRGQEAEPPMEVDGDDIPPLTSDDATTVTPEEDEMLTGCLLTAISLRTAKPPSRSRPPPCVNEVLYLSPPHSLRGRRKTLMSGLGKKL